MIGKNMPVFAMVLLALSCHAAIDDPKAENIKDRPQAQSAATPNLQTCQIVENLELVLDSEAPPIVLIGEVHGYTGAPALVEAILCHARKTGLKTQLAMELPKDREAIAHDFIRSTGDKKAYRAILSDSRWTSPGDGRRTASSFRLLEYLREQAGDNKTRLTYFVPAEPKVRAMMQGMSFTDAYEIVLADNLKADFKQNKPDKMVVLTGNLHASRGQNTFAGERYLTMASYFDADEAISFNISLQAAPVMSLKLLDKEPTYDGVYFVPDDEKAKMMPNTFR